MSFILDALRKSEGERQRQLGPTLLSLPASSRRRGVPVWVWLLVALLIVNGLILLWLGLRNPAAVPKMAVATPPAQRAATTTTPSPSAPTVAAPVPNPAVESAPAPLERPVIASRPTLPANDSDENLPNPADTEPAVAPPPGRLSREAVQSYEAVSDHVPPLRLDLHVYAARRDDRYALINMHKVHEGDTLPEGPRVLQITRDAVILNYQGEDFSLGRE